MAKGLPALAGALFTGSFVQIAENRSVILFSMLLVLASFALGWHFSTRYNKGYRNEIASPNRI